MKNIGGNALVIREVNIHLVRKALKELKQATQRQLAEATGLSVVTVGTVLRHLVRENEALETEFAASSGGRPAQQYRYNEEFALALTLFPYEKQGSIFIRRIVVSLAGNRIRDYDTTVDRVNLASLESLIDQSLADYPSIQAIGFGLPGAEFEGKMVVIDYDQLLGVSVAEHFRIRYGKPVVIENDVNAAVIGYCKRNRIAADRSVVYFYFPDRFPPGAGIMIQGKLYRGNRGFAGEIAHMPLGIDWTVTALSSGDRLNDAIGKLTVAVCSVLNPDLVVLNGNRIGPVQLDAATQACSLQLPSGAVPELALSDDFAGDYATGMTERTLGTLEPHLQITKKED